MEDGAAFSPDGNQVAFTSSGAVPDGSEGLYTTMIGGEKPLRLTSNPGDCCPAWSPDARSVAYARGHPGGRTIYVVPALGGTPKELYSEESVFKEHIGKLPWFSWSPDGRYLAVSALSTPEKRPTITLVSLQDSSRLPLTSPPPEYSDWCPAFSPDGKSIAFLRSSGPGLVDDLYVVPAAGGEPKRLTSDKRPMEGPFAWTPDSREIIFSSYRSGLRSLWRIPAAGGTPRRVEGVGTPTSAPAIAQIGNRLAYTVEVLKVKSLEGSPHRCQACRRPASIDPSLLMVLSVLHLSLPTAKSWPTSLLNRATTKYGRLAATVPIQRNSRSSRAWLELPAGRMMVAPWPSTIAPTSTAKFIGLTFGGPPRLIPTIPGADNVVPSWSRDGKWIYFSSNRGNEPNQVWKVPDAGGTPIQLTRKAESRRPRVPTVLSTIPKRSAVMRYGRFPQTAERKL